MHADMTAVTIQSNKIVSNEVKGNKVLLKPLYGKKRMNLLANPIESTQPSSEVAGEIFSRRWT